MSEGTASLSGRDRWRAMQAQARLHRSQALDGAITVLAQLVLIAVLLYVMIGSAPYQHELVFDPLTGGALMSPVNRIIWLCLFAAALPIILFRAREAAPAIRKIWPVLILFGWFVLTTTWSIDHAAASRRLFLYIVGLVVCLAVLVGIEDRRKLHLTAAVACAIVVVIDIVSWGVAPSVSMTELGLAAIHNHKNTLGAVMLFCAMVIGPYCLSVTTTKDRAIWFGLLLGCLILLVASRSKTSIALCVVAGLIGYVLTQLAQWSWRSLSSIGAVLATLLSFLILGWLIYCSATGTDLLGPLAKVTFTKRTDVWRFVIEQIAQRPVKGVGFGSFWDVDPAVQPSKQTDLWFARPDAPTNEAHNGYLDLAATTGLPGLLMALVLLFGWIIKGFLSLRNGMLSFSPDRYQRIFLSLYPIIFFIHNWMESSYFTANSAYGFIILLVGLNIDLSGMSRDSNQIMHASSKA